MSHAVSNMNQRNTSAVQHVTEPRLHEKQPPPNNNLYLWAACIMDITLCIPRFFSFCYFWSHFLLLMLCCTSGFAKINFHGVPYMGLIKSYVCPAHIDMWFGHCFHLRQRWSLCFQCSVHVSSPHCRVIWLFVFPFHIGVGYVFMLLFCLSVSNITEKRRDIFPWKMYIPGTTFKDASDRHQHRSFTFFISLV